MQNILKKTLCGVLSLLMILSLFAGCGKAVPDDSVTGDPALNSTDEVLSIGSVFYLNLENSIGAVNDWHIASGENCVSLNQTSNNSVEITAKAEGEAVVHCEFIDGERTVGLTCNFTVVPATFQLSPTSAFMQYGQSLSLNVFPAFSAKLVWQSSDTNVCVVDNYGKITAVGVGSASITAALEKKPDINVTAQINVIEGSFVNGNMSVVPSRFEAQIGSTVTLTASGGSGTFTWMSSDTSKATVTDGGIVTLLSAGTVTITATDTVGTKATSVISVYMAPSQITVSPATLQLVKGGTAQLSANISPSKANKGINWYSSDPAIAKVDKNGKVTMVGEGTVTITAQSVYNTVKGSATVTSGESVTGIKADHETLTVKAGETFTAGASVLPKTAAIDTYSVSISDTKIVKQSGNDNKSFVAIAPGTATITYTSTEGRHTAKCVVTVSNNMKSATISPNIGNVSVGGKIQMTITTDPENADKTGEWKISDSSVATVDQNGLVTGVKVGSTSVSFTFKGGNLTVVSAVKVTEGITISQKEASLNVGEKKKLTVSVGSADVTGTWSSGQTSVATVSESGEVTAVSLGKASITFTPSNKDYGAVTCEITVCEKATSVKIQPPLIYMKKGEKTTLSADVLPETASQTGKWSVSSGEEVGTITENGEFTAVKEGHAVVKFTATEEVFATADIFVGPRASAVAFAKAKYSVEVGKTLQLEPGFLPEDTVDKAGTYTVGDALIASVDKQGVVTGNCVGVTTVTFVSRDGELKATCEITVTQKNDHTLNVKYSTTTIDHSVLQSGLEERTVEAVLSPAAVGAVYSFEDLGKHEKLKLTPNDNKCKLQAEEALETTILVKVKVADTTYSTYFTLKIVAPSATPTPSPAP